MQNDKPPEQTTEIGEGGIECVPPSELHGIDAAVAAERARCSAWARLYYDGDLADDYEMYVGIRDGLVPPWHLNEIERLRKALHSTNAPDTPKTTDPDWWTYANDRATWLADRAGLPHNHDRLVWIDACMGILDCVRRNKGAPR